MVFLKQIIHFLTGSSSKGDTGPPEESWFLNALAFANAAAKRGLRSLSIKYNSTHGVAVVQGDGLAHVFEKNSHVGSEFDSIFGSYYLQVILTEEVSKAVPAHVVLKEFSLV